VDDLRWDSADRSSGSLRIKTSKANQFGEAEWVPFEDFGESSAAGLLRAYVERFHIDQGPASSPLFPAFPSISTCSRAISHEAFTRRFRRLLDKAGLPASGFTGHSFRSGGATDLFNGRCRPHTIRLQGRWLSDAIWIYVRDCPEHRRMEVAAAFQRVAHLYA
jgi:integrase